MTVRRFEVPVTAAADGSATAYSPWLSGRLASLHYVKTDFADGVDFTITSEATGESLWVESNVNASTVRYPRAATHNGSGVAALFASGGTPVQAPIALGRDRVKIAIAAGGNAKSGKFLILIED